jgi:phosphoglycerol transferase MdoB-like AlkP superfamily enzyme
MYNVAKLTRTSKPLFEALRSFVLLSVISLAIVLLLRFFELGYNLYSHSAKTNLFQLCGAALSIDLLFWFRFCTLQLLIFLPLFFLNQKLSKIVFGVIAFVYLLLQLSLTLYFSQALVPLGADVYGYSVTDIRQTIGASGHVSIALASLIIALIIGCVATFYFVPKKISLSIRAVFSVTILTTISVTLSSFAVVPRAAEGSEFLSNLALNKTDFFLTQSFQHFFPEENETDIYADSYAGDDDKVSSIAKFDYPDESHYPFLHKDSTHDVLSPFLRKEKQPPNIVILLVEGLGRAFTNEGAYLGNFTPFIDSLSKESMYWENFLSEGGRTFAVLPSVIGSLPFYKNGFAETGDKMPAHLSLISLLKLNGYHTSFSYGGDSKFDNMQLFLKKNNIDEVSDESTFGDGYAQMPKSTNGFSWGYGDKELFRKYFTNRKIAQKNSFLDIVLTVSTHAPFLVNDQQQYLNKFEERLQQLGFEENKKKEYREYKYQYASILYTDDAIRNFINTYAKRADFSNTIFFITGDHRMPEIPMASRIDRYHVPLLIYSPLLKRTAKISSISTHFDIAPSILAYIKANYRVQLPSLVSWMGSGLDTTRSLNSTHAYPLLQTKTELVDFLEGDNLLNNSQLFNLKQGLKSSPIKDDARVATMLHSFNEFKKKNDKVINGAPLLPDSIYSRYFPR